MLIGIGLRAFIHSCECTYVYVSVCIFTMFHKKNNFSDIDVFIMTNLDMYLLFIFVACVLKCCGNTHISKNEKGR